MRTTANSLVLAGILLGSFYYWGLNTKSGRSRFDEMAGIIPMFAGLLACAAVAVAVILYLILWKRTR